MDEKEYKIISKWFRYKENRLKIFTFVYICLPFILALLYFVTIYMSAENGVEKDLVKVLAIPAVTFLICTIVRKLANFKRPYENMNIKPLINKNKKGQSFPSRHMVSASIIMMSGFYTNFLMGMLLLILTIIIGFVRVIAGVHYIRDILAGIAFGIVCGLIGFLII